jgi:hypothetical protein
MQPHRPKAPGKSKTDLRRGQFTPGRPVARKSEAPRANTATTLAEQGLLFADAARVEPTFTEQRDE